MSLHTPRPQLPRFARPRSLLLALALPALAQAYQPPQRSALMVNIVTVVASCTVATGAQEMLVDCGRQTGYQVRVEGEAVSHVSPRTLQLPDGEGEPRVVSVLF